MPPAGTGEGESAVTARSVTAPKYPTAASWSDNRVVTVKSDSKLSGKSALLRVYVNRVNRLPIA